MVIAFNGRWPYILVSLLTVALLALMAGWREPDDPAVTASLHGVAEFEPVWCQLNVWLRGYLGKGIAGFMVLVGMVVSIHDRSFIPLAVGVGCGLSLLFTPDLIHWLMGTHDHGLCSGCTRLG